MERRSEFLSELTNAAFDGFHATIPAPVFLSMTERLLREIL